MMKQYYQQNIQADMHNLQRCKICQQFKRIVDGRYAKCLGCKRTLDLYTDVATPLAQPGITEMTANGSYILPNGIVVLADADVEAYINGTLEFYSVNDATE